MLCHFYAAFYAAVFEHGQNCTFIFLLYPVLGIEVKRQGDSLKRSGEEGLIGRKKSEEMIVGGRDE